MSDLCGDNRFEIIEAYKKKLIEHTNIEKCPEEMAVIDSILFRFWQMRWIPTLEIIHCRECKHRDVDNGFCEGRGWPMQLVPDDGFCDKGERSEESNGPS